MTYEIRPNCYEGMNPTSWQVFETEAHGPGSVVAVCLREGNARRIRDLLNDCTITTANQLATLHGNFARLMADRDAAYERWRVSLDRLDSMRKQLAEVRTERDTLLKERDAAQAGQREAERQLGEVKAERDTLAAKLQNGSGPATITGLTEALNTAAHCVVLHPDARSAFELLAKVYEGGGK